MIHSFKCENFYSFKKQSQVNFVVNEKAADNDGYFNASSGTRLSKVEAVIGPNASGKTNLLKVLPFLKWFIVDSFNIHPEAQIPLKPFLFSNNKSKPINLSVEFETGNNIYCYRTSLSVERVLHEELKVKSKSKERMTWKLIFSRKWVDSQDQYEFTEKKFDLPKGFQKLLPQKASIISVAMRLNHAKSQEIAKYWQTLETNVIEAGWVGDRFLPNAGMQLIEALDYYSQNSELKEMAEKLLSKFDLGLESFNIKKEKQESGFSLNVEVAHNFNGRVEYLPVPYESSGTKQLFIVLKTVLLVLKRGGMAVLDELDVNLHPEIVSSLIEMFINPETNPHKAQILFSSHSHLILNQLDKYQIIFTEKDRNGASDAWRLDEMTGVRADDNYFTKYIAGAYGALPKID